MSETFPRGTREAIFGFHLADRMKAQLTLVSSLLQSLLQLQGAEELGARRLFLELLRAVDQDLTLCQSVIKEGDMIRLKTVFTGIRGMVADGQLQDLQPHLTWMITVMTTYAQRAMEYLQREKLI